MNNTNWKLFLTGAFTSIFSWRLYAKEMFLIVWAWGAYLIILMLMQGPEMKESSWTMFIETLAFSMAVLLSIISAFIASAKSALPAVIGWFLVIPLYLSGFAGAAKVTLFAACLALVLYILGFLLQGGRTQGIDHK
jgi:hypothetical protein